VNTGFEYGLRTGVELPLGDIDSGNQFRKASLSGVAEYRVPIVLDLGYRVTPPLWLGLAAQAGTGGFGDSCGEGAQCEWSDVRLAAQMMYRLTPRGGMDAWLGAGLGWEWLRGSITQTAEVTLEDEPVTVALEANELRGGPQVFLQTGLGFDLGETLRLGPYLAAAAGQYLTESFSCSTGLDCSEQQDVENRVHGWISLGVRVSHGP
jgi:hypothetical protein